VIGAAHIAIIMLVGLPLAYLALLSILACFARPGTVRSAGRRRRFAIVIPAYNEESCIGETVLSALAIDYPADAYDVVVVADNCTDRTAVRAHAAGARVLVRSSEHERSKGHALRWAFERLLGEGYEAFAVCDADSTMSANFLQVVNDTMHQGAGAVQCSDLVKPAPGAWSSEATRAGFLLYNVARPLGRMVLGCSAGLRGNGMGFTAGTLRRVPWRAFGRAEDLEYGLILLLNGIPVQFAPSAFVVAIMPADARNAESQRARWEGGRYPLIRRYAWPLLRESALRRSFRLFDAWTDLVTPPFTNLMFIAGAGLATDMIALGTGLTTDPVFVVLWLGALAGGIAHVVFGFASAGKLSELMALMKHVPLYVAWKVRLYARITTTRNSYGWVRTTREAPTVPEKL
jgi:cellulose synthase/poly-beta-1,6-N-acetylglucosamine synthase-like glycosyltransferase